MSCYGEQPGLEGHLLMTLTLATCKIMARPLVLMTTLMSLAGTTSMLVLMFLSPRLAGDLTKLPDAHQFVIET